MDLIFEIQNKMSQLDLSLKTLRKSGEEFAKAERDYKECVSKTVLKLRAENTPATIINLIVYGMPDVSTLRFKRDIAKSVLEANEEAINVLKLELRILQSQYEREYTNEITE